MTEKRMNIDMKTEEKQGLSFHTKSIIVTALVAVAVVIALAFTILTQSGYLYSGLAAVEVNGTKYSATDFNFYYMYSYNNYYSYLSEMLGEDSAASLMPTNGTSFRTQVVNEETGATWYDNFKDMTLDNLEELTDIRDRAAKEGFTLPEDYTARVESDIADMTSTAVTNGYSLAQFLTAYYGKGMTESVLRRNLELYYLSQAYTSAKIGEMTFTADELSAAYEAHKDEFDTYTFYGALVTAEDETEEALAAAKAIAENLAEAHTEADLLLAALNNGVSASPYTAQGSNLAEQYATWLSDAGRAYGDTEIFETDGGYYVFLYTGRDGNDYNTVNAAYVAVSVVAPEREETDTDETYGEKADAAAAEARATAEEINAAWQSGNYATLNELTAAFTGKVSAASTYDKAGRNDVGSVFTSWLFDESHEPNDSAVLDGTSASYVIIYLGEDVNLRVRLAQSALVEEATDAWSASVGEGYEAVEKAGMRFTGGIWYERVSY